MAKGPSKKDFVNLINQMADETIMTEQDLQQILKGAKETFDSKGLNGFMEYIRNVTQVPFTQEYIENIIKQTKSPEDLQKTFKHYTLPSEKKITDFADTKRNVDMNKWK